jgi:hypothetical protein
MTDEEFRVAERRVNTSRDLISKINKLNGMIKQFGKEGGAKQLTVTCPYGYNIMDDVRSACSHLVEGRMRTVILAQLNAECENLKSELEKI